MAWYIYLICCIAVSGPFLLMDKFKPGCLLSILTFLVACSLLFMGEKCFGYNPSWFIGTSAMVALLVLAGFGRMMQKKGLKLLPGCLISMILLAIFFLAGYYVFEAGVKMIEGDY